MADRVLIYAIAHQPRRLRLPAQPIPDGASVEDIERCLFDEAMNQRYFEKVAKYCYYPAVEMFTQMVKEGVQVSLGFSVSLLEQAKRWDPQLLTKFRGLVRRKAVELIGVEPYHSFLMYVDIGRFVERLREMADYQQETLGQRPVVTDTTEMMMSNDIYYAVRQAGFQGVFMDGREWVLNWRQPSYLYHYEPDCKIFTRHTKLSDDVGYRFSNRGWESWPLQASQYCDWIAAAEGNLLTLAWDFETFGEHHSVDTGIFDFMRWLPKELSRRKVNTCTPSGAIEALGEESYHLPLPEFPCTWAGGGGMEFFLGNSAQMAVFQLMHHAYNKAKLTGNPRLIDLAEWLLQSDNLHLIQWYGRTGSEAEVSAYFTPDEWWDLGPNGIISEIQLVYRNFIRALDSHID